MSLEGTVKLPGIGPVKKKTAVLGGAGAVVGVLAVWWYRQRKASEAAAAAATTSGSAGMVTDPAGNTCTALDPTTGYCPGTAEDQQALADAAALGTGDTGALDDLADTTGGGGGTTSTGTTAAATFTTNAQWAQYAEAYLITTLGGSASDVGNAIGKYLTGQALTSDQQNIVQEAIAYAGLPPVSGESGDPPGLNTAAATSSPSSGGSSSTSTSSGSGSSSPGAPAPITVAPAGFRVVSVTNGDTVNLAWNAVKGATGYVIAYGPTPGSQAYKQGVSGGATTAATVAGVGGGAAGKHYFELWATPAKTGGPHAGPIEATTTKS